MKICVPVINEEGLSSRLYSHFGSAPFYAVVETETALVRTVANSDCQHRKGECSPVDYVRDLGIDTVVCNGMGRRACTALRKAGIDVMFCDAVTVRGVVAAARDNNLTAPTDDDMCSGHGHHARG